MKAAVFMLTSKFKY